MHSSTRASVVAFITILTVSAGLMLWLFWRFPLITAIVALGVVAALCVLVRLAPLMEFDPDVDDREPAPRFHQVPLFSDTEAAKELPRQVIAG